MRLVVQRVVKASVSSESTNEILGHIDKGLFILLGVKVGDTKEMSKVLAEKVLKLRVMSDKNGKMNLTVSDVGAKILVVSQFTLYANTNDGNRPSFIEAELPEKAREIYEDFTKNLKASGMCVETGKFGEYMKIDAVLDGPVTIIMER